MVTVSVPGKVHLMGEHAVVYGKPALLAAINLRLSVTIREAPRGSKEKTPIVIRTTEPREYAVYAVDFLLKRLGVHEHPPVEIIIDSSIPAGFHLGSSAAVAVGLAGACMYFFKKLWNPILINELAYEIEKKQHGNPSGGDNTTATMGGFIWYRRELEFLKSIWQFPFKPHESLNHFFLINTGRPKESTGDMVALVQRKMLASMSEMSLLFEENERQTRKLTVALKEGNENELMDAIRTGERTLEEMGVVSKRVLPLIREIEKTGGAAKILGGGGASDGVGFLLCYSVDEDRIKAICLARGYSTQPIVLGEEGVRLERKL